jgi:hypothetical protein
MNDLTVNWDIGISAYRFSHNPCLQLGFYLLEGAYRAGPMIRVAPAHEDRAAGVIGEDGTNPRRSTSFQTALVDTMRTRSAAFLAPSFSMIRAR